MSKNVSVNTGTLLEENPTVLVDIRNVTVDKNLPREERIAEYVRQIRNPYCFRCGKFTVRARFSDNGLTLEESLKGLLL